MKRQNFLMPVLTKALELMRLTIDACLNEALYQSPLRRIERLKQVLREVYPIAYDEWVDGFLWDKHPVQEIRRMECAAYIYLNM